MKYLSVFSPNAGKYGPEKLQTWTLFTQCDSAPLITFFMLIFQNWYGRLAIYIDPYALMAKSMAWF